MSFSNMFTETDTLPPNMDSRTFYGDRDPRFTPSSYESETSTYEGRNCPAHDVQQRRAIAQRFWDDDDTLVGEESNPSNRHHEAASRANKPKTTVDEKRSAPVNKPNAPVGRPDGLLNFMKQFRASLGEAWEDGKHDMPDEGDSPDKVILEILANRVVGLHAAVRRVEAMTKILFYAVIAMIAGILAMITILTILILTMVW
ncbi:hypothetical protein F5B17DRAFT_336876 [Nemania serpens]|nr:hypothetical protein F5B17DRAFT_336876 [Nemania serpens]